MAAACNALWSAAGPARRVVVQGYVETALEGEMKSATTPTKYQETDAVPNV